MKAVNYPSIVFFYLVIYVTLICQRLNADVSWATVKKPIVVLVIDTGFDSEHNYFKKFKINCEESQDCRDIQGHGTHVMSLILGGEFKAKKPTNEVCSRVIVHSCDYEPLMLAMRYEHCLEVAVRLKPDYVNYSSSGEVPWEFEYELIKSMSNTTWVVATGNEGSPLFEAPRFPAMYAHTEQLKGEWKGKDPLKNIIAVGALTHDNQRYIKSGTMPDMKWMLGVNVQGATVANGYGLKTGTSMATALYTNKLLKERCDEP